MARSRQRWDAEGYVRQAAFVPLLGEAVVDLLAPRRGERILDLGCGDGALTERLVAAGAVVQGVDLSPELVSVALGRGLSVALGDGQRLAEVGAYDAVFFECRAALDAGGGGGG